MAVQKKTYTAAEFEAFTLLPENADRRFELINGEITEAPSNPYSSEVASLIIRFLGNFVYPRRLGRITGEQGGYIVAGVRLAPDAAFVSRARQAALPKLGYNPIAPDLAVEVVSPSDKEKDIETKLKLYLAAGVLVWMVYPERQQVDVYAPGQLKRIMGIDDTLDGGEVLPGFTLPVREIFPD